MFEYKIQAYNETAGLKSNHIIVTVTAGTEDEAIERAKQIVNRNHFAIAEIKELNRGFKKIKKG